LAVIQRSAFCDEGSLFDSHPTAQFSSATLRESELPALT